MAFLYRLYIKNYITIILLRNALLFPSAQPNLSFPAFFPNDMSINMSLMDLFLTSRRLKCPFDLSNIISILSQPLVFLYCTSRSIIITLRSKSNNSQRVVIMRLETSYTILIEDIDPVLLFVLLANEKDKLWGPKLHLEAIGFRAHVHRCYRNLICKSLRVAQRFLEGRNSVEKRGGPRDDLEVSGSAHALRNV